MTKNNEINNGLIFEELEPVPRLLMGPGPCDLYPRVLKAMSSTILGQFDPHFTEYMNQVMTLFRQVYCTDNRWTFLVNGTARAGIEACLTSMIIPGDKVLVPIFGRFGHLLKEIAERCGAKVVTIEAEWGTVFEPDQIEQALVRNKCKLIAMVHGDTSTTMAQPLEEIGAICRANNAFLFIDACATLGGMPIQVDDWQIDAITSGLQKCLGGPPGSSPITFNDRVADLVNFRKHIEEGIRPQNFKAGEGPKIQSNYFDLAMLMDYWSSDRLNHHTEAASMLYAARECARIILADGLKDTFSRHRLSSTALREGLKAMGLKLYGDEKNRMHNVTGVFIPKNIDGERVRNEMLRDFGIEIGTSFGPLHGIIWRIGTMGYVCQKVNILRCLSSLDAVLRRNGFNGPANAGVEAAYSVYQNLEPVRSV